MWPMRCPTRIEKSDELWEEMRTNRHLRDRGAPGRRGGRPRHARPRGARARKRPEQRQDLPATVQRPDRRGRTRRHCDFRLMDLMNHERPVSLYIVTRGGDKERLRPLVRLLLTMAMRALMGVELKFEDGQPLMPHRHRLLMMLDEFPSLGRLQLHRGRAAEMRRLRHQGVSRGAGPRADVPAPTASIRASPPTATSASSTRRTNGEPAKWVSEMVGNTTIVKEDVTESGTRFGPLRNVSRTYHQVSRPLVTPDEIMELKKPVKDRRRPDPRGRRDGGVRRRRARRSPARRSSTSWIRCSPAERRSRLRRPARRGATDGVPDRMSCPGTGQGRHGVARVASRHGCRRGADAGDRAGRSGWVARQRHGLDAAGTLDACGARTRQSSAARSSASARPTAPPSARRPSAATFRPASVPAAMSRW